MDVTIEVLEEKTPARRPFGLFKHFRSLPSKTAGDGRIVML